MSEIWRTIQARRATVNGTLNVGLSSPIPGVMRARMSHPPDSLQDLPVHGIRDVRVL